MNRYINLGTKKKIHPTNSILLLKENTSKRNTCLSLTRIHRLVLSEVIDQVTQNH